MVEVKVVLFTAKDCMPACKDLLGGHLLLACMQQSAWR